MTGLHGKRATGKSRRSTPLGRSMTEAAPPPARRTKRRLLCGERDPEDTTPAPPPPKRSRSLPAYGDQGPTDVSVAPPPPAPRAKAPAPLPKRESSIRAGWPPTTAYVLRNRRVPARYEERWYLSYYFSSPATQSVPYFISLQGRSYMYGSGVLVSADTNGM
jgi:hypothetical protein